MDFTPDLLAFQGVFISTDSAHPFSRLTVKGGKLNGIKNTNCSSYLLNLISKHLYYL